jgi:hypothetical protein
MPVLIHDGDRIQRECGIGLGRAMRLQDGSHLEAKNGMQQRWRIGPHLAKPINWREIADVQPISVHDHTVRKTSDNGAQSDKVPCWMQLWTQLPL